MIFSFFKRWRSDLRIFWAVMRVWDRECLSETGGVMRLLWMSRCETMICLVLHSDYGLAHCRFNTRARMGGKGRAGAKV